MDSKYQNAKCACITADWNETTRTCAEIFCIVLGTISVCRKPVINEIIITRYPRHVDT